MADLVKERSEELGRSGGLRRRRDAVVPAIPTDFVTIGPQTLEFLPSQGT